MNSFDEVYDRIKFATNARTQVELASLLEIRQSSISDAKRRRSIPAEWYIKLHDKFGLNLDWLRWRTGPILSKDKTCPEGDPTGQLGDACTLEPGESGFLLREDAPPDMPMGKGRLGKVLSTACTVLEEGSPQTFTTREYTVLPEKMLDEDTLVFFLESKGMEPTLREGAYVGVATASRNIEPGKIYAFLMPHEGVAFRRVINDREPGLFLLCFDFPGLPSTRMPMQAVQAKVLGKVIWTLQAV